MSMPPAAPQIARIARQHLETSQLLGVDVLPICTKTAAPETCNGSSQIEVVVDSDAAQAAIQSHASEVQKSALFQPETAVNAVIAKTGNSASKAVALDRLRADHDQACPHCTTVTYHTRTVFGEGDADAKLMFIGEAPGEEEDRTGRPFVGRAGQKLNEIIKAMGLEREQVYIANILKSRPPDNRTPLQHEVDACGPFLTEQIRIIQPLAIVALGGPSAKYLLKTEIGITRIRGQWGWFEELELRVPVMPTFHPAFLLRQYTPENRKKVWSDMQAVLVKLREVGN